MTTPAPLSERVEEMLALAAKATPRPWEWRYCAGGGSPHLVHRRHGMLYVMEAARKGFNGATLRFVTREQPTDGGILHDAETFFRKPGRDVPDIQEPSNPDMAYLAAAANLAPELAAALAEATAKLASESMDADGWYDKVANLENKLAAAEREGERMRALCGEAARKAAVTQWRHENDCAWFSLGQSCNCGALTMTARLQIGANIRPGAGGGA